MSKRLKKRTHFFFQLFKFGLFNIGSEAEIKPSSKFEYGILLKWSTGNEKIEKNEETLKY